ncbi:hypothetical protein ACFQX6_05625 [Streptosporangium lutulentum]
MTTGDSREFFDRALLRRDGRWENVEPTADIRTVDRGGPPAFDARPMGVLDVPALAAVTGAPNVRFDLGVGDSCGTLAAGRRPTRSTPTCGAGTTATCRRPFARWSATRWGRPI